MNTGVSAAAIVAVRHRRGSGKSHTRNHCRVTSSRLSVSTKPYSLGVGIRSAITMSKSKPKSRSPFWGRWRIISMTAWDKDYFDQEVQAYIRFDANDTGEFHFGYVRAIMNCRERTREGIPDVEWTWESNDEMHPV